MIPDRLLIHSREGERIEPRWLGPEDLPWLEGLLGRRDRAVGRRQIELEDLLLQGSTAPKWRLAVKVLARAVKPVRDGALDPPSVRAALFGMAASQPIREAAVLAAAALLAALPADVEAALFADLPGERKVPPLAKPLSPEELRRRTNAALAAGFLARASSVAVRTAGDISPLVRHARWTGLIAERRGDRRVTLSGPFTLFRHTVLYGRALAGVLGALARIGEFEADVHVVLRGEPGTLRLDHTLPIFTDAESRVAKHGPAARLAREILKLAPGWSAIVDPDPLSTGTGELLDADLRLTPPDGSGPIHVELLRFWTATDVQRRLDRWRLAGARALLLLDADRNAGEAPPPESPAVLTFHRRAAAPSVLERLLLPIRPST